jgi:hypothetical protein
MHANMVSSVTTLIVGQIIRIVDENLAEMDIDVGSAYVIFYILPQTRAQLKINVAI